MIYLDYAASTPVLPQVKEKLIKTLDIYGNPSSLHDEGQKANEIIWKTKDIVSKTLNCSKDEIFFTSGATMSNSIILNGFNHHVISSVIEHEDIQMISEFFGDIKICVDSNGYIDMDNLKMILNDCVVYEYPTLFSIQMANGEIGTIQNIKEISKLIHSYPNCYLHTDATQYIPYYPVNVKELGIDALSMSGQKIGCIKGVGMAYISSELQEYISPIIFGKQGLVGGTENVPGIACLGEAFNQLSYNNNKMLILRDRLIGGLNGKLVGNTENRLPNNVCMCFEGIRAESIVAMLDEYGICCSAGSACSSGDNKPSATLLAIGLSEYKANSCVRFSIGNQNTEEEIDETINTTNRVIDILRELE